MAAVHVNPVPSIKDKTCMGYSAGLPADDMADDMMGININYESHIDKASVSRPQALLQSGGPAMSALDDIS